MKKNYFNIILAIMSFFVPLLFLPHFLGHYNLPKFYMLIACAILLLIGIIKNYKELKTDLINYTSILYLFLTILSTVFAIIPNLALTGSELRYDGLISFICYILIFLSAKEFLVYDKIFIKILKIMALITSTIAILQYFIILPDLKDFIPLINNGNCGANGTFGNPNFFGSFISMFSVIAFAMFILKGGKSNFIVASISAFALIVCSTRSAWLAVGICCLLGLVFIIKEKKAIYWKRIGIIAVTGIILFGASFSTGSGFLSGKINIIAEDIKNISTEGVTKNTGSDRLFIWSTCLSVIKVYPVFGCGFDNLHLGLMKADRANFDLFIENTGTYIDKAHNEYLHIACTNGLPALALYLSLLALILVPKFKIMFKNRTYFILCLAAISYLVQAFFNISTIGATPLFWLLLGIICNDKFCDDFDKDVISTEKLLE